MHEANRQAEARCLSTSPAAAKCMEDILIQVCLELEKIAGQPDVPSKSHVAECSYTALTSWNSENEPSETMGCTTLS